MGARRATPVPVYLVHWNAPEWCASAAASLLASEGVDVGLTVVDNGQEGGPPLASCLPDGVRILKRAANGGYTAGANAALDDWRVTHPTASFAVLGSHDLHVESDTLAQLLATAEAVPHCGVLGPAVTGPREPVSGGIACGGRWFELPLDGAPELAERDWVNGTCMLLRRACVDEVGPFDERFGSYAEDVDYGLRARDRGWQVMVLTTARARGLGTVSARAADNKVANTVLLAAKRGGVRGAGTWVARLAFQTLVGATAGVLSGRGADARRRSAADSRQCARILRRLAADRRLPAMLRAHVGASDGSTSDREGVAASLMPAWRADGS